MRTLRIIMAAIGGFLTFGAVGTDDRYTQMRQMPPNDLWIPFVVGLALMLPVLLHKGGKKTK